MMKRLLVAGLLLGVAACASEPPHRGPGREFRHRGGPPSGEMRRGVFISPSGEPFRGHDGLRAWFAGADTDHDGAITLAEFQADALRFFHVLDANHDGQVDGFEIQAYEHDIAPEITVMDFDREAGMGRHGGGRGRNGAPFSLINEAEPVANADENVDSKVSLEEWNHATLRRFNLLDKAKTGRLTLDALEGRKPPPKSGPARRR